MDASIVEHRNALYSMLTTPFESEKSILYGLICCSELFLDHFITLPFEFVKSTFIIIFSLPKWFYNLIHKNENKTKNTFHVNYNIYTIIYTLIFVCSVYFSITKISIAYLYHMLRRQSFLKLYGFYTMLEWSDRMLSLLHVDCLLSVASRCSISPLIKKFEFKGFNKILHYIKELIKSVVEVIVSILTNYIHVLSMLCQFCIIAVSLTSPGYNLYALLVSTKFTELKAAIFKKFDFVSIFQITLSDITNKFYTILIFLLVLIYSSSSVIWEPPEFMDPIINLTKNLIKWFSNFAFDTIIYIFSNEKLAKIIKGYIIKGTSDKIINQIFLIIFEYILETIVDSVKHAYLVRHNMGDSKTMYKYYKQTLVNDEKKSKNFIEKQAVFLRRTGFDTMSICIFVILVLKSSKESFISIFINENLSKYINTTFINLILKLCQKTEALSKFYAMNKYEIIEIIKFINPIIIVWSKLIIAKYIIKLLKHIRKGKKIEYNEKTLNSLEEVWRFRLIGKQCPF